LTARFRTSGGKCLDFPVMKKRSVSMSANALIMTILVNILFMNVKGKLAGKLWEPGVRDRLFRGTRVDPAGEAGAIQGGHAGIIKNNMSLTPVFSGFSLI
jgi:hypothetical protein